MYTKNHKNGGMPPSSIPPAYRGNAFGTALSEQSAAQSVMEQKPAPIEKRGECAALSRFGKEELLLVTLIILLIGGGGDELLTLMLCVILASGL